MQEITALWQKSKKWGVTGAQVGGLVRRGVGLEDGSPVMKGLGGSGVRTPPRGSGECWRVSRRERNIGLHFGQISLAVESGYREAGRCVRGQCDDSQAER